MRNILTLAVILFCSVSALSQEFTLSGIVLDPNDAAIERFTARLIDNSGRSTPCTNEGSGRFFCRTVASRDFSIEIEAEGFESIRRRFAISSNLAEEIRFELLPRNTRADVIVTADRTEARLGDSPASIVVLSRAEIAATAAPTLDDTLRQIPGFSIFRRSSSRNANPTTQGVSLRGVGASGASRSLVIFDGVPLNDPFGGWVQWNRVPAIAVDRVEVLRGGASSLYGNSALSGNVNIIPRRSKQFLFSAEAFGGTQKTLSGSAYMGGAAKGWMADGYAATFQTRGYIPVDEAQRGIVDSYSGSRSTAGAIRIGRNLGKNVSVCLKPSFFGEVRSNGTGLQTNRTHSRQFVAGGEIDLERAGLPFKSGKAEFRIYGGTQVYDQIFSAVNASRNAESLTRVQRVPSQELGFSGTISTIYQSHALLFGVEGREVRGTSDETVFQSNVATSIVSAGGRERTLGIFAKDFISVGDKLVLAGSMRFDSWRNYRAQSSTIVLATGQTAITIFDDRKESALSPRFSVLYRAAASFSLHATASRSFRAPTLNELYRSFRVGNVLTLANENLRAERATNLEAGASFGRNGFNARGTVFWTAIDQPVANITLNFNPTLITRQRQNAGRTRASGIELEFDKRWKQFNLSAGYLFADSRITDFPANPVLEGLWVPQVPRHQFTFQTQFHADSWLFSAQGRASGKQFDDDLNLFRLEPYFQLDIFASKSFSGDLQVFAAIENLFSSRYSVGRTPIRTVSSPINLRIGFRWK